MIGRGMWYSKKGVPKSRLEKVAFVHAFNKRLANYSDELVFALGKYESQVMQLQLEKEAELKKLRNLLPQASIKVKLNTSDSTIPDCHFPHRIVYKYTYPADQITKLVFCSTSKRVYTLARLRGNIAITFNVCANEQMCKENYLQQGFVKKIDNQLAIVPPGFEDRFVSCCIEHPAEQEFELITRELPEFLKSVEQEWQIPESDSSGSDFLSSEEEDDE